MNEIGFLMNYKDLQKLFTPEIKELLENDGADFDDLDTDMQELLLESGFDDIRFCDIAEVFNIENGGRKQYLNENAIFIYAEKTGLYEKYENKQELFEEIKNKLNNMEYENKILNLFKNGYLTTKDVNDNNIPRFYLTKLIKENKIERVSRGVYIKKNELVDEFVILQSKSNNAIYSNMTALYLHGFSNRIPLKYDITINNGYNGSLQKNNNVNLFYTKKELLNLGVIDYKLDFGNIIRVYDLDKTICDIIKNKKKLDSELFNKAIREYFFSKKKNTLKLYEYAKKMNIYNKVRDIFEVLK